MARLLVKNGVLFQHLPRTGGTWVEDAIDQCQIRHNRWTEKQPTWICRKHALLSHYWPSQMHRVQWVFVFVRHPVQYYESVWRWMRRERVHERLLEMGYGWHPHNLAAKWFQPDFNDWVFLMLHKEPQWYTRLVEAYVGPEGGEFCDYIGRTETIVDDFFEAMQLFGYGEKVERSRDQLLKMGKRNMTTGMVYWSPDLKSKLLDSERLVTQRFYGDNLGRRLYAKLAEREAAEVVGRGTGSQSVH